MKALKYIIPLLLLAAVVVTAALSFNTPAASASQSEAEAQEPAAQPAAALTATVAPQDNIEATIAALRADLNEALGRISALETQAASNSGSGGIVSAPTNTPQSPAPPAATATTPGNVIEVKVLEKSPVYAIDKWKNGYPIMEIREPRIIFAVGEWIQVLQPPVYDLGGNKYFEIFTPRARGYFIRAVDIGR